jgi:hypothetical protein
LLLFILTTADEVQIKLIGIKFFAQSNWRDGGFDASPLRSLLQGDDVAPVSINIEEVRI